MAEYLLEVGGAAPGRQRGLLRGRLSIAASGAAADSGSDDECRLSPIAAARPPIAPHLLRLAEADSTEAAQRQGSRACLADSESGGSVVCSSVRALPPAAAPRSACGSLALWACGPRPATVPDPGPRRARGGPARRVASAAGGGGRPGARQQQGSPAACWGLVTDVVEPHPDALHWRPLLSVCDLSDWGPELDTCSRLKDLARKAAPAYDAVLSGAASNTGCGTSEARGIEVVLRHATEVSAGLGRPNPVLCCASAMLLARIAPRCGALAHCASRCQDVLHEALFAPGTAADPGEELAALSGVPPLPSPASARSIPSMRSASAPVSLVSSGLSRSGSRRSPRSPRSPATPAHPLLEDDTDPREEGELRKHVRRGRLTAVAYQPKQELDHLLRPTPTDSLACFLRRNSYFELYHRITASSRDVEQRALKVHQSMQKRMMIVDCGVGRWQSLVLRFVMRIWCHGVAAHRRRANRLRQLRDHLRSRQHLRKHLAAWRLYVRQTAGAKRLMSTKAQITALLHQGRTQECTVQNTRDNMNVLFDRLTRAEEEQLEAENKLAQAKARLEELQGLLLLDVLPTADEDTVESGGYTPLFFAVYKRRYEVLKLLLRAGADISARSQPATRLTALCQTCMLKTTADTRSIFRTLLGCTPDSIPVCGVGVFRQEPRNAATNEQRKELIGQWLEQWKRNIDLRSGSTVRPADIAEYAKIKAVYAKIKAGRNKCIERPKILVEEHWVPQVDHWLQQFHVRDWGLLEFRQLVARHCYPPLHPDPPVLAGRYGMPRWAVGMISDEYGINEPEANGVTPLMAAVRNRALPLVEDLIRLGALPNLTNIDHDTVLHIAVNAVWVDCTRTLCTQCTQLFEWERAWDAPVIEGRKRGFERAAFPKYADMYMDMWVRGGKHAIPSECAEALNNRNLIQIFEQHITGPQAAGQGSRPPGAQLCAPGALDNSIPDKWTCLICTSLLCQPAKLPCGHVFCLRCITKAIGDIVRSDKSLSGLICPFRCEQRPVQLPWLDEDCHRLLSTGEWWAPQKLTPEEEAEEGRRLDTGERYYRKHITERLSQRAADCLREFKPTRRDPTEDTVPDLMLNESGRCPVEIHGKRVQYAMVQDVLHVTSVVMTGKEVEQVQMPCDWVRLARLYLFVLEGNYRGRSACSGSVTLNDLNELVMHLHIQLDLAFRSAAKECTTLICRATEPYRTTLMQLVGKEEGTRPVVPTEIPNPENLAEVRGNMFKVRLMVSCLQHMLLEAPAHGGDADTGGENKEWYCRTASPTDGQWVCEAEGEHPVHLEYDEAPDVIRVTTTVLEQFPHRVDVQGRLFGMLLRGNVQPEGGPPRGVEYIEQSLPGLSPAIHDGSVILQMAVQVGASPHTKLRDSFRDYVKFAGALRDKSNKIINQIQPPQSPEATSISTTERQLQHQIVERRVLQQSGISADQRQTIISMANNLIYDLDFLELHIAFVNRGGAEGPNPFEELDAEAAKAQQEPPEHSASRHRVILSDDTVRRRKGLSVFPFTLDIAWAVLTLVWELAARGKVRDVQVYLDAPGGTILSSKVWHRFVYCSDGGLFSTRVLLEWLHCIAQCNSVVQAPLFIDNSHCSAILDEPARNSKVFEHLPRPWKTRMPPDAHTERERRRSRTIKLEGRRRAARLGATGDIGVHGVVPPKESEMAAAAPPQTSAVGESPQLPRSMGKRFRCSQRAARKAQGLDAKSRELAARMSRQDTVESNVKNERRIPCVVCGGRGYVEE
eukprot:TRINITY_DN675_c1_g1_i1.p1 TRINITY_DN675_c1_g1~~TRINITY_DN675_c1_g1_i1.p1  ORF type:complete len:1742 (+),score=573.76 TRINITY_DN675_c1_g1_i1:120-5345(+)